MTEENFKNRFAVLLNCFPSDRVTPETQGAYWLVLQKIPDDVWDAGIKRYLVAGTFFPTIHDLGVACFGEQKEEYIWKCDPWREHQNYREKVEPETWQQRMEKILAPQIEGPSERPQLSRPRRPDPIKASTILHSIVREFGEKEEAKERIVKERRVVNIEERKKILREQMEILKKNNG